MDDFNPLKTSGLTDSELRATPVPISGSITATPSGTQDVNIVSSVSLFVTGTFYQATQPVSGSVGRTWDLGFLTDQVDASGSSVLISNFPANQPISGTVTANQGTSPWVVSLSSTTITGSVAVTGPLTDAQLRASSVPVSGTFFQATQPVSGTVTANQGTSPWVVSLTSTTITGSVAVTGPLTDAQLRASVVPVSLSSTTITGSVAVTGTFWQATQPVSGTVTANQGTSPWVVSLTSTTVTGTVSVTQSGTWTNNVQGVSADGATAPTNPVLIGGQDGANLQSLRTDTTGNLGSYPKSTITTLSDGLANNPSIILTESGVGIANLSYGFSFNGTTWDRLRGDTGGIFTHQSASSTTIGLSTDRQAALLNTAVAVKASSGRLYGYHFYNPNASVVYVHFYDVAQGSVTVGTTTPKLTFALPSTATATIGVDNLFTTPVTFSTAITMAASTTITGGTAPVTGVLTNTFYL